MNYRTLKLGERLKDGDQWWDNDDRTWNKTVNVGVKVKQKDLTVYDMRDRRPVSYAIKKPVNFKRLALRMSKAKSITEVRAMYKKAVGK